MEKSSITMAVSSAMFAARVVAGDPEPVSSAKTGQKRSMSNQREARALPLSQHIMGSGGGFLTQDF